MLGKIAEFFSNFTNNEMPDLPDVYLDFSSQVQRYSTVSLRIRNKSAGPVVIERLEFVDTESNKTLDISELLIGGRKVIDSPFPPNGPGVLDFKGNLFRAKLKTMKPKGKIVGKIVARVPEGSAPIAPSPRIDVDVDNNSVIYHHVGRRGRR